MENGEGEGSESALQHHEAHLGDGGVSERTLHAGLGQHDDGGEEGGEGADEGEGIEGGGRVGNDGAEADDEEAAGIDDSGVHESGDRGG